MCLDEIEHDKNFSLNTLGFENFHIKMYADRSMLVDQALCPTFVRYGQSSLMGYCRQQLQIEIPIIAFLAPLIVIPLNFTVVVVIVVSECTE